MLASIELHHGAYAPDPACCALEVYGVEPESLLVAALEEQGRTEIVRSDAFFLAQKA